MTEQQESLPLDQQCARWKARAEYLRAQVKGSFESARASGDLGEYRRALEEVRGYQDTMEEMLVLAITASGAMHRAQAAAQAAYEEAWAAEVARDGSTAVRRGPDMEGPRERYARFDLRVFGQLRAWRQAEQGAHMVREVLDEMNVRYRAVNDTRRDLHEIMRSVQVESALERTLWTCSASRRATA